jgi:DNA-directed RNA polymerase specialized sigma24 family protein
VAQKHLRDVAKAARQVEQARAGLRRAIMAAQESGETIRDIAPFAGLSITRVHELLREAKREEKPSP